MKMNFVVEYKDKTGETFFEEQYSSFIVSESEGIEWIKSQNVKYSDRIFIIDSFVRNPALEQILNKQI